MSNILNLLSEETFAEKMDTQNALLAAIASGNGGIKFTSFKDLQRITRLGLASKVLAIGDQIVCERASTTVATVGNSDGTPGITAATVVRDAFIHAIGTAHNGDYEFYWDGAAWHYDNSPVELSAYGITVTGTPALGDEIVVHETATALVWDVIGIDCDTPADPQFTHSVTLGLHECFAEMPFDNREALFYCAEGLAAGTYHFTVTERPAVSGDANKTFQFTLTQAIPAGGQIALQAGNATPLSGSTLKTYESAVSTSEIETATITEGAEGADLGTVSNAVNNDTNALDRAIIGNNYYVHSAIRQYINSSAAAGSVWTGQTKFDRPPDWASNTAGFLNGMDEDFLSVIGEVTKKTAYVTGATTFSDVTTSERFFLLSRTEVYGGNEITGGEGAAYPYYADYSDHAAPASADDANRIKHINGVAKYWWLRTPGYGSMRSERVVSSTGYAASSQMVNSGNGLAPACCIV